MDLAGAEALMERIATASREVVFLVGSPLTMPAKGSPLGVPGVSGMVERIKTISRSRPRALDALEKELAKEHLNPYQTAFRHILHYRGADTANEVIRTAVLEARHPSARPADARLDTDDCSKLENDLDGWYYPPAVEALGRLAATHPARFGHTILTTNFDPLIELSIRRARGRAFSTLLHGDGSLEQSRGEGCHVVHVHGYWHGTDTLHSPLQLGQERPQLRASLARLFQNRTVVVMAYGGWDDIFTRTLQDVTADQGAFPDVLWCFYEADEVRVRQHHAKLLEQLRPAITRHRATFYAGIDCHSFLPELVDDLSQGVPEIRAEARDDSEPARNDAAFVGRAAQRDVLFAALDRSQPVQLIGPRRMGKSSLLRWVERTAKSLGKPVAFVNARGLAGRSPSDLVLGASWALGRYAEAKAELYKESALPDPQAAERVLASLSPVCLLVDEADALAEAGHGFKGGFFDALRALGQSGKVTWISASEHDLFEQFQSTGLTSSFLNDARKLYVGCLSRDEAEAFLKERAPRSPHGAWAYELAGGFPPVLGWIADRLAERREDKEALERELRRWADPLFAWWWQRLGNDTERALLKRLAGDATQAANLPDGLRRTARRLANLGFVVENEERFRLGGRAWEDFVRNVDAAG